MQISIAEMKKRNAAVGQHWFSKETMQFFGSIIMCSPDVNNVFITAEWKDVDRRKRAFTLRKFNLESNEVETIGDFLAYDTLMAARKARRNLKRG